MDIPTPLIRFVRRLQALPNRPVAERLLWLAAEGRLELCADGKIGVWCDDPAVLESASARVVGPRVLRASWSGPRSESAAWCAVNPRAVSAVRQGAKQQVLLTAASLHRLFMVEAED